jgi:Rieske Fe-S protein
MIGGSVVAMGVGCGDNVSGTSTGTGGGGGAGGGTTSSTDATTSSTTSTTASTTSSTTSTTSTGGGNCEPNPVGTKLGKPSDYMNNGLHIVPGSKVLVGRDANGLYALTSLCTHQFCNMDSSQFGQPVGTIFSKGIVCNCHGSEFGVDGSVIAGPAIKPLKAFALALGCDGYLYADTATVVPNTQRLQA